MAAAIKIKVRLKDNTARVGKAAKKATVSNLGQAGAYIRGIAKKSIKVSQKVSPPGKPPHTRKGRLKGSIVFAVEKTKSGVVVGPSVSEVGKIGHTHEFGGTEPPKKRNARKTNWKLAVGGHGPVDVGPGGPRVAKLKTQRQVERAQRVVATLPPAQGGPASTKRRTYPARPFMGPALQIARERIPRLWANSVRGG